MSIRTNINISTPCSKQLGTSKNLHTVSPSFSRSLSFACDLASVAGDDYPAGQARAAISTGTDVVIVSPLRSLPIHGRKRGSARTCGRAGSFTSRRGDCTILHIAELHSCLEIVALAGNDYTSEHARSFSARGTDIVMGTKSLLPSMVAREDTLDPELNRAERYSDQEAKLKNWFRRIAVY